ncbi:leukocyte elastase inhibitor-like [Tetranychus urticae]|uniref:leukocyte elastase inhibitor-like n=1 Tax=Tetranychus urticae TaxID=32264 RepID=UPI00077BFDE2|nr:leukocyte elastase inhibitor-like [Tetranychus urticae]
MSHISNPSIEFGLKFLKKINSASDSTNLLLSPLSVIIAYCMVLEGAAGETEKQIKEVLDLDEIDNQHGGISEIIKQLLESYKTNKNCILEFGNLLVGNTIFKLKDTFVQSLQTNYSADAFNEDFNNNGKNVMEKVNSWVSENTKNKIATILNEPPNPDAVCLLLNAIYFEGSWLNPFPKRCTHDKIFNNSDGSTTKVKMMLHAGRYHFLESPEKKLKIVEIPYGENMSMILVLPIGDNNLKKMVDNLDSAELSRLIDSMTRTRLDSLMIPKFKLEDKHQLHEILPSMGMILPFDRMSAEFPKITERLVYISQSIQKALIEVTETGTVAAAVTKSACTSARAPSKVINFIADRPFLFFIRDNLTNVNLFMGQLNNMSSIQSL